jgi:hypothetical protein
MKNSNAKENKHYFAETKNVTGKAQEDSDAPGAGRIPRGHGDELHGALV